MINTKKYLDIENNKSLKIENSISVRRKMTQEEAQLEITKILQYLESNQIQQNGPMIYTTHNVERVGGEEILDMEFIVPVDRKIDVPDDYQFKPIFHLVNAIYKRHVGHPERLQDTYDELLNYLQENQLQQITSGYNVSVNDDEVALGEPPIIDVYIGVNPSIL